MHFSNRYSPLETMETNQEETSDNDIKVALHTQRVRWVPNQNNEMTQSQMTIKLFSQNTTIVIVNNISVLPRNIRSQKY